MTATVTLARASDAPVARLPLAAILNRGSGPLVYVVDAVRRAGAAAGDGRVVHRGHARWSPPASSDGDKVVTLGVQKLEAGLKVRTIEVAQ